MTAELLAMMYDASLDKIVPNHFYFRPIYLNPGTPYAWICPFRYNFNNRIILSDHIFRRPSYPVTPLSFSELQTYVSSHSHYRFSTKALGNTYMTGSAKLAASDFAEAASDEAGSSGMPTPEINYRENFQETAFSIPNYKQIRKDMSISVLLYLTRQPNGNSQLSPRHPPYGPGNYPKRSLLPNR